MQKREVHTKISQLLEKMELLNANLAKSGRLIHVECDLMQAYAKELSETVGQLENFMQAPAPPEEPPTPEVTGAEAQPVSETVEPETQPEEPIKAKETEEESAAAVEAAELEAATATPQEEESPVKEEPPQPAPETPTTASQNSNGHPPADENAEPETESTPEPPTSPTPPEETTEEADRPSLNEKLGRETIDLSDKLQQGKVEDLRASMDFSEKYQFAHELFEGDVDGFERSIHRLNQMPTLQEAERFLENEVKPKYSWEDKQETLGKFRELLKRRFEDN